MILNELFVSEGIIFSCYSVDLISVSFARFASWFIHEYKQHKSTLYLIQCACTTTVYACYWMCYFVFGSSLFIIDDKDIWPHSLAGFGDVIEFCTPSRTEIATPENKIYLFLTVYTVQGYGRFVTHLLSFGIKLCSMCSLRACNL